MEKVMVIQKLMGAAVLALSSLVWMLEGDLTATLCLSPIWGTMIFSKEPCIQL